MHDTPLDGVRVVDLTQVMAGPFCTMILADLGADVIKVEPPGGDQTRHSWGDTAGGQDSTAFHGLNRNKRSVCLDLKTAQGRADLHALVRTADVVVHNWRPGVAERLGADYPTLSALNPALVYANISGFGGTGPYADRPGYDLIAQGMTGAMSVTGEPGGRPVKNGLPVGDLGAGLLCVSGILAAYLYRLRTGTGQQVETSLYEATLAMSIWESTEYWATGRAPRPLGSANRMSAPYQALRTRDGHLTVGANNERLWQRLCAALDMRHLAEDPRFATNMDRLRNREELVVELEARLVEDTTAGWVDALLAAGVPAGPILDYAEVLDADPHVRARELVREIDHPAAGRVRVLAPPLRLHRTPATVRTHPPLLGEHTEEILAELREGTSAAGSAVAGSRSAGEVRVRRDGDVVRVVLSNPDRRNALTFPMYDQLLAACDVADEPGVRVVVLRGDGGRAFAAGTDIREFTGLAGLAGLAGSAGAAAEEGLEYERRVGRVLGGGPGAAAAEEGLEYERRVGRVLDRLLALRAPLIGVVEGPAVGGGLALAAACDVVLATPDAVFGAPIARTLGNCLPAPVVARLQDRLGSGRALAMLLTAELLDAETARTAGLVQHVVDRDELDERLDALLARVRGSAPLTLAALKETDRRLRAAAARVDTDDLLRRCYGSADFREGVHAFLDRRTPHWRGQ
ncbi:CoA transferase [Streptomyces sp. B6B3]|uniref:CoA transferase n=1 Tax=Streptomyces sp. B6B3 TaxID=3153570 RepID=UPI00325D0083